MGNPTKYDQTIKTSDIGKILYSKWLRIHKQDNCCEEFKDFMKFYNWAMESGYKINMTMLRYDSREPYSPDNCFWVEHRPKQVHGSDLKRSIDKFDETVARIRKACGMEPLKKTEETQSEKGE